MSKSRKLHAKKSRALARASEDTVDQLTKRLLTAIHDHSEVEMFAAFAELWKAIPRRSQAEIRVHIAAFKMSGEALVAVADAMRCLLNGKAPDVAFGRGSRELLAEANSLPRSLKYSLPTPRRATKPPKQPRSSRSGSARLN